MTHGTGDNEHSTYCSRHSLLDVGMSQYSVDQSEVDSDTLQDLQLLKTIAEHVESTLHSRLLQCDCSMSAMRKQRHGSRLTYSIWPVGIVKELWPLHC